MALAALLACACGPSTPAKTTTPTATATAVEPPPPPTPEPIETGKDCAKATTECGGGVCLAKVKNDCAEPVTCELAILAACSGTEITGDARSKERATIPAKTESEFSARGDCQGGRVDLTTAESMSCK
jgi:hypothetical protein